ERLVCIQEVTGSSPVFSTKVFVACDGRSLTSTEVNCLAAQKFPRAFDSDSSLTTEYPTNGSFFRPHTRSV
ncbi:uncharacterized protein METZ01_LOCUS299820, partial [marine metagenome]